MDTDRMLARSQDIGTKVAVLFRKRAENAQREFTERLTRAAEDNGMADLATDPAIFLYLDPAVTKRKF